MAYLIEYLFVELVQAVLPYMEFAPGSDFGPILIQSPDCGCLG